MYVLCVYVVCIPCNVYVCIYVCIYVCMFFFCVRAWRVCEVMCVCVCLFNSAMRKQKIRFGRPPRARRERKRVCLWLVNFVLLLRRLLLLSTTTTTTTT